MAWARWLFLLWGTLVGAVLTVGTLMGPALTEGTLMGPALTEGTLMGAVLIVGTLMGAVLTVGTLMGAVLTVGTYSGNRPGQDRHGEPPPKRPCVAGRHVASSVWGSEHTAHGPPIRNTGEHLPCVKATADGLSPLSGWTGLPRLAHPGLRIAISTVLQRARLHRPGGERPPLGVACARGTHWVSVPPTQPHA